MVISVLARGGSERQLLATTTGLVERGYAIEIFTMAEVPAGEPSFKAEFTALGIRVTCAADLIDTSPAAGPPAADPFGLAPLADVLDHLNVVSLGASLARTIRRFRPHVVHCWSELSCLVGGHVAVRARVRRIVLQFVSVTPLQQELRGAELYRKAFRKLLPRRKVVMLNISEANARAFEHWIGAPRDSVRLLRNGLLPGTVEVRPREATRRYREMLGIPATAPVVGTVMRFADEKDPGLWLETAARVAAARPQTHFVMAGYGALRERIAARIAALGLADRFVLPGPVSDVGAVHAALDVFLMTSRFEGTPNALVEAQAAGVAVVAPAVGGVAETVADEITGVVVPTRTAEHLAQAVVRILDNSAFRQRAASAGPQFVAERFSWQVKIDRTISYYELLPRRGFAAWRSRLRDLVKLALARGCHADPAKSPVKSPASTVQTASCAVAGAADGVKAANDCGGSGS